MFVFAIGIRLPGINASLWIDEAGSVARATAENFWATARADVHPPLYFLLLRWGLQVTNSFAILRLFSVAAGVGLVGAGIFFFRRTPVAAIALGSILAGLPELVSQSEQLRPYALLFLLLGVALMISIQIASGECTRGARISLTLVLVAAAATHIGTAFFILALAPLLAWPARKSGPRAVAISLLPLVPSGVVLLVLEFGFLQSPAGLPEGWWIPRARPGQIAAALSDATGWTDLAALGDDASRHAAGGGAVLRAVGFGAAVYGIFAAWGRRRRAPVSVLLLASGLVYLVTLVAYSQVTEPLVIGRTILPGLLPIAAGIALGIAANPRSAQRAGALVAIAVFFLLASEHGLRRAFTPAKGLRGLAAEARGRYRPGDQVVLLRAMDYGLRPYWADLPGTLPVEIDQTQPIGAQLSALRLRLDSLGPSARLLVICRDDYYLRAFSAEVAAVLAVFSERGFTLRETWREGDLFMLEGVRGGTKGGGAP